MQINHIQRKTPNTKRMIVARGGKRGKTSGRGGKGQSARSGNKRRPEWRDIIKRLPKLRGRGVNQNKFVTAKTVAINVDVLEAIFSANDAINPVTLIERGIVSRLSGNIPSIKILGEGEVTKAFKVSNLLISESAKAKIEKAGGSVTPVPSRVVVKVRAVVAPKADKPAAVATEAAPVKKAAPAKKVAPKTEKVEKKAAPKKEKKA